MSPVDRVKGARLTIAAEKRRRQEQAPLLDAAGVLAPLPTVDEIVEKQLAADQVYAEQQREIDEAHARDIARYEAALTAAAGVERLAEIQSEFERGKWPKKPEYRLDHYCAKLAELTGRTKLQVFEDLRKGDD